MNTTTPQPNAGPATQGQSRSVTPHPPLRTLYITPTEHEKAEWSRLAQAAYRAGNTSVGHRFSAAGALPRGAKMPLPEFDELQTIYRKWLTVGEITKNCLKCELNRKFGRGPCAQHERRIS